MQPPTTTPGVSQTLSQTVDFGMEIDQQVWCIPAVRMSLAVFLFFTDHALQSVPRRQTTRIHIAVLGMRQSEG
jgi:hypothetical protein